MHIFAYLKKQPKVTLYFNTELPALDPVILRDNETPEDFLELYRDGHEEMPHNMPKLRGRSIIIATFVDTSHASNHVSRQSQTVFVQPYAYYLV